MGLDWVIRGALMADAHLGYTLPIGGVVETDGMVVPSWVGYDIGCGVCAVRTTFDIEEVRANCDKIYGMIQEYIPVGFKHNTRPVTWRAYKDMPKTAWFNEMFMEKGGFKQIGTLGGGNHFIEIGYNVADDSIWIVIHSGSRNVGHSTAQYYMKEACFLAEGVRKAREGHYPFKLTSGLGLDYLKDQRVCLDFALVNRTEMIDRIETAMRVFCDGEVMQDSLINRTHNHAEVKEVGKVIHRKGATHAEKDMLGVIPGNMRDGSFIVQGLGNVDSLSSSSHGAGRLLGRKKAKELLDVNTFRTAMVDVTCKADGTTLDESPMAYKDIEIVMDAQRELVTAINHIRPIINVKG
jgi:tRNA-splicing ligase RtcB